MLLQLKSSAVVTFFMQKQITEGSTSAGISLATENEQTSTLIKSLCSEERAAIYQPKQRANISHRRFFTLTLCCEAKCQSSCWETTSISWFLQWNSFISHIFGSNLVWKIGPIKFKCLPSFLFLNELSKILL